MSLKLEPAIFKRFEIMCSRQYGGRSEWLAVKIELRLENRSICIDLVGREVTKFCIALLGCEPKERLKDALFQLRNKAVGVCWEQIRNNPSETRICSFFHINEADAAAIPPDKPKVRRSKNK